MTPRPNNASKLKLGKQTGFCVSVNDEQNRYRVPWHEPRGPRSELRLRAGGLPRSEPRSLAQCRTSAPSSAQLKRQLILTALICRRLHAFIFSFGVSCLLSFVRRRSQGCVLSALPRTEINCRDAGRVCVQPVPMSCGYEEAADSARRGAGAGRSADKTNRHFRVATHFVRLRTEMRRKMTMSSDRDELAAILPKQKFGH